MNEKIEDYLTITEDNFQSIQIDDEKTLLEALSFMVDNTLEFCVVVKGMIPLGLITATKLMAKREIQDFDTRTVGEVVTQVEPLYLEPWDLMKTAAEMMVDHPNIDEILIRKGNRIVGILEKTSVLKWMNEVLQEKFSSS